jgi:hypothetical protein
VVTDVILVGKITVRFGSLELQPNLDRPFLIQAHANEQVFLELNLLFKTS